MGFAFPPLILLFFRGLLLCYNPRTRWLPNNLISQKSVRVEQFVRETNGHWTYSAITQPDANMTLHALACTISVTEIYHKVQL